MRSRFLAECGAEAPIIQAPMAGAGGVALAAAAIRGGAVGSLPSAMLSSDIMREQVGAVRRQASGPLNLNFFCHTLGDPPDDSAWRAVLAPYYAAEQVTAGDPPPLRRPFDAEKCAAVEALRPDLVSFHFGLPEPALLARVRAAGIRIVGNATTVEEARWLAERGCDAIIAQGAEAGGHAGWFLDRHRPIPLAELLPAIVDAVPLPVIAAGGITNGSDLVEALRSGADAVQIGTAYLATSESLIGAPHRALLGTAQADDAAFTTLFSGRQARGIRNYIMRELGLTPPAVPPFPYASAALAPLRAKAEKEGRADYSPLWAGAGAASVRTMPAEALTRALVHEAEAALKAMEEA
ncbi:nitronate monooxygenase family protein [Stakelama sediminis]|uniref:Propionate 3-nitronate monooxygenase n=1 Tax=Stakelama sediminis TaxID=463200 RepID=A0A840YZP0_9SPHN|nr:nitronate monooxygenase [Stakelama sediminis]MBB5719007.1 nitronate monooxygenase [Stakelama sediminis]